MNRTQKASIFALVIYCLSALLLLSALASIFILEEKSPVSFISYFAMIAILISPMIAYFSLRKKQSPAEPESDERDKIIKYKAATVALVVVWIFLMVASMLPGFLMGEDGSIPVFVLPLINLGVFLDTMAVYSIAVIIQYGRGYDGKE